MSPFSLNKCLGPCPPRSFIVEWNKEKPGKITAAEMLLNHREGKGWAGWRSLAPRWPTCKQSFKTGLLAELSFRSPWAAHTSWVYVRDLAAHGTQDLCHLIFISSTEHIFERKLENKQAFLGSNPTCTISCLSCTCSSHFKTEIKSISLDCFEANTKEYIQSMWDLLFFPTFIWGRGTVKTVFFSLNQIIFGTL